MNRIAELRKSKYLNQTGLAMKLNISQYLVSAYETGRHQPSIEILMEMSKLFNVSVDYIIGNTDVKAPVNAYDEAHLSTQESELLSIFRNLDSKNKERAIGMLMSLDYGNHN